MEAIFKKHPNCAFQVCTNVNRCHCDVGFGGPDCALVVPVTTPLPTDAQPTADNTIKMEKKETNYGKRSSDQCHWPTQPNSASKQKFTQKNQTNNDDILRELLKPKNAFTSHNYSQTCVLNFLSRHQSIYQIQLALMVSENSKFNHTSNGRTFQAIANNISNSMGERKNSRKIPI